MGTQDSRLAVAAGRQDLGLTLTFCQQNRGSLVALGPGTLLHRITNRGRRLNGPQLNPVDFDTPFASGLVKD